MKRYGILIVVILVLSSVVSSVSAAKSSLKSKKILSKVFSIEDIYPSMKGPWQQQELTLLDSPEPELVWITGYGAEMVDEDGVKQQSQEFMCHSNLDLNMDLHRRIFDWKKVPPDRLFTLSQGQFNIDFPEGFGIPMLSNEPLNLVMQVLNLNEGNDNKKVRHNVRIDFIRDKDLKKPMRALFFQSADGKKLLKGKSRYFGMMEADPEVHGPGCMIGENADQHVYVDYYGQKFTGHWVVKPGREVNRTLVTNWMNIPFETRAHYIAVHVHPFAESLELKDLTTGESVFKSMITPSKDRIGIDNIEYYSSEEGIPLYPGHEYELISVYNNTTDQDQDAMAVMYLYLEDKEFVKPDLSEVGEKIKIAKRALKKQVMAKEHIVLHTDFGDIVLGLYPEVAPEHVKQLLKLTKLGVYDSTHIIRVSPHQYIQISDAGERSEPMTARQKMAIKPLKAEFSDLFHKRGTLSMSHYANLYDSAETSFTITLNDAPHLDGQYTVFGHVVEGMDVVDKIQKVETGGDFFPEQRVAIHKAEVVEYQSKPTM